MISALVNAGLKAGYLVSARLATVHGQAGNRLLPAPSVSVAGESLLWVDPAEIPAGADVAGLGQALGAGRHGGRDELMALTAAYSGLRWGELAALTVPQVDTAGRVIMVGVAQVEPAGRMIMCGSHAATVPEVISVASLWNSCCGTTSGTVERRFRGVCGKVGRGVHFQGCGTGQATGFTSARRSGRPPRVRSPDRSCR